MPARESHTAGAPCWIDLQTSDVDRARAFYGEVFGWTADDPNPDFGNYINFRKDGVLVAGLMRADDQAPGQRHLVRLPRHGRRREDHRSSRRPRAPRSSCRRCRWGTWARWASSSTRRAAAIGLWQPGTHRGFGRVAEPGAPRWWELLTRDYAGALSFYRDVFGWRTQTLSDTDDFRYTVQLEADGEGQLAGILDAAGGLPADVPPHWGVYIAVADTDEAVAQITALGGSVVQPATDTPFGRLAHVTDPMGGAPADHRRERGRAREGVTGAAEDASVTRAASARSTSSPTSRTPATRSPSSWTPKASTTSTCSGSRAGRTSRRRRSCCRRRPGRRLPACGSSRRSNELPFAGHPTLGSCHAWLEAGGAPKPGDVVVQECGAGLVPRPPHRRRARVRGSAARALRAGRRRDARTSSASSRIDRERRRRPNWVDNGPGWVGVLLESADAVLGAAARRRRSRHRRRRALPRPARRRPSRCARSSLSTATTGEDPVTGSLNAALAEWLLATGRAQAPYTARQGTALGRDGRVRITRDNDGRIWTGGGP